MRQNRLNQPVRAEAECECPESNFRVNLVTEQHSLDLFEMKAEYIRHGVVQASLQGWRRSHHAGVMHSFCSMSMATALSQSRRYSSVIYTRHPPCDDGCICRRDWRRMSNSVRHGRTNMMSLRQCAEASRNMACLVKGACSSNRSIQVKIAVGRGLNSAQCRQSHETMLHMHDRQTYSAWQHSVLCYR